MEVNDQMIATWPVLRYRSIFIMLDFSNQYGII